MKCQKGFSAVEGLLILVIVGMIGFVGWYVYQAKNKTDTTYNNAASLSNAAKNAKKSITPAVNSTADWVSYSNTGQKYSLKYPKTWVKTDCSGVLLLIAADQAHLGKCDSDSTGQMYVGASDGDTRDQSDPMKAGTSTDCVKSDVTVDNVKGQKFICTMAEGIPIGPPAGTKFTQYIFFTNNMTYVSAYFQLSGASDALSDYNTMITSTLKFSS